MQENEELRLQPSVAPAVGRPLLGICFACGLLAPYLVACQQSDVEGDTWPVRETENYGVTNVYNAETLGREDLRRLFGRQIWRDGEQIFETTANWQIRYQIYVRPDAQGPNEEATLALELPVSPQYLVFGTDLTYRTGENSDGMPFTIPGDQGLNLHRIVTINGVLESRYVDENMKPKPPQQGDVLTISHVVYIPKNFMAVNGLVSMKTLNANVRDEPGANHPKKIGAFDVLYIYEDGQWKFNEVRVVSGSLAIGGLEDSEYEQNPYNCKVCSWCHEFPGHIVDPNDRLQYTPPPE